MNSFLFVSSVNLVDMSCVVSSTLWALVSSFLKLGLSTCLSRPLLALITRVFAVERKYLLTQ